MTKDKASKELEEMYAEEEALDTELAKEGVITMQTTTPVVPQPAPKAPEQKEVQNFIKDEVFDKATGRWEFWKWTEESHLYTLRGFAFKNQNTGEWELDRTKPDGFDSAPKCNVLVAEIDGKVCCDPDGKTYPKKGQITANIHLDQMKPLINEAIADGSMTIVASIRRWKENGDWKYETINMKNQGTLGDKQ